MNPKTESLPSLEPSGASMEQACSFEAHYSEEPDVRLTEAARAQVLKLLKQSGNENAKLRVYIIGGGCSGFQYGFKLDEIANADDKIIKIDADNLSEPQIRIVVDALSLQYLMGSEIDYIVNLQGARYAVNNPNAETTCSCGSSFSLKEE